MGKELSPEEQEMMQTFWGSHSLLSEWIRGYDITEYLENPHAEGMIVVAAVELEKLNDLQEEWIELVKGDGLDQRRLQLVERCRAQIAMRNNKKKDGLFSPPYGSFLWEMADGLISKWISGSDLTSDINSPKMESVIIEAAMLLENMLMIDYETYDLALWLSTVEGDGLDPRRNDLARRCREATEEE